MMYLQFWLGLSLRNVSQGVASGTKLTISQADLASALTELRILLREVDNAHFRLNIVTEDEVTNARGRVAQ